MLILKLTGSLFFVAASYLLALKTSMRHSLRSSELKTFIDVLNKLTSEISYSNTKLSDAFVKICVKKKNVAEEIFTDIAGDLQKGDGMTVGESFFNNKRKDDLYLNEDDLGYLSQLFEIIGKSDREDQIYHIKTSIACLEEQKNEAQIIAKKKRNLLPKLSVSLSVMIVIAFF